MLSSFQQNWFYFIRTSIAKDVAFLVCEKEFLNFPIWFYNILLNYDVSLHNLVVLIVTIPTSRRLSKTEFICKSYGALNLPLDLPRSWSGVSGHTGVSGTSIFRCRLSAAVRFCMGVRSSPGEGPESPAHRSLRPEEPESPAFIFLSSFASVWCTSG